MNKKWAFFIPSLAALGLILSMACLWPSAAAAPGSNTAITQTWQALSAFSQQETEEPSEVEDGSDSDENTDPAAESTPGPPMISVSVDTNCRSGPGLAYEYLGALMTYEEAEVLAQGSLPGFWVIENPDHLGTECWVGEQYASIVGDTSNLPVRTPPPLPEPEPGTISGYVFIDANNNNQRDPQELPLVDVWVYLDEGECPGGALVQKVVTSSDGYYIFSDVAPGVYCVSRHDIISLPINHQITLGEGEQLTGINFRLLPPGWEDPPDQ